MRAFVACTVVIGLLLAVPAAAEDNGIVRRVDGKAFRPVDPRDQVEVAASRAVGAIVCMAGAGSVMTGFVLRIPNATRDVVITSPSPTIDNNGRQLQDCRFYADYPDLSRGNQIVRWELGGTFAKDMDLFDYLTNVFKDWAVGVLAERVSQEARTLPYSPDAAKFQARGVSQVYLLGADPGFRDEPGKVVAAGACSIIALPDDAVGETNLLALHDCNLAAGIIGGPILIKSRTGSTVACVSSVILGDDVAEVLFNRAPLNGCVVIAGAFEEAMLRLAGVANPPKPSLPAQRPAASPPPAVAAAPPPAAQPPAARPQQPAAPPPAAIAGARDCPECPEMMVVPAGRFFMGSPANEPEHDNDELRHEVRIPKSFAVGKYEVMFAEWDACVAAGGCNGYRPDDQGWGRGRRPVINVSWEDARAYVAWLSRRAGQKYRLLTEAEWEYMARAGTTTAYPSGAILAGRGNVDSEKTMPVGQYAANAWGIYDVAGNVAEWVEDCYESDYNATPADGAPYLFAGGACAYKVFRGGSWASSARNARVAYRDLELAETRVDTMGFRVAKTRPAPAPAPAAPPVAAAPPPAAPLPVIEMDVLLYVREADIVNVRAGPSTAAQQMAQIRRRDGIVVTGRTATEPLWYRVQLPDGRTGFVLGTYLGAQEAR